MKIDFARYKIYLDERVRCYPFIGEMIDFYKGLIDIWDGAPPDDLSPLFSTERLSMGLHLLDKGKIGDVDFSNSIETARKIFTLMEEQKREDTMALVGVSIQDIGQDIGQDIDEFIKRGLSREDRFTNAILKWILKPSFNYTIEKIKVDATSWNGERCLICYAPPGMALVDTLGTELNSVPTEQRFLSCCFCGYRWLFDLVACPACGNNRPEKHGFFVGESGCEQGARAVSCEECKTYIKTVFIRCRNDGMGPMDLDMDIEDAATILLDLIANQRGYRALCQG